MPKKTHALSVLHFSTGKTFRGGERQAMLLHKGLMSRDIKSTLVARKGGELASLHIPHENQISWLGEWDIAGLFNLIRICKLHKPSILHAHDAHALAHASIAGTTLSIPVVYTRRVVFPLKSSYFSKKKYLACSAIIAISQAVAKQCRSIVPPARVHIVGDGVNEESLMLPRTEAREILGVNVDSFVIGTVAHFTKEKAFSLIKHCAQALDTKRPDIRFVCIGPIDDKSKKNIPDNLICTGSLPDAVQYYNAFDAYLSTSTHEGLGSALLDAVIRDIPTIAVDAEGTRDLYPEKWPLIDKKDHKACVDAVLRCAHTYKIAKHDAVLCGARARKIFSNDLIVDKTIEVYKHIHD